MAALFLLSPAWAHAEAGDWYATLYGARISMQPGWEDNIIDPFGIEFADSYLVPAALAREYANGTDCRSRSFAVGSFAAPASPLSGIWTHGG